MEQDMMLTPEEMDAYIGNINNVPMTVDATTATAFPDAAAGMMIFGVGLFFLIFFVLGVIMIASMWKIFSKAGKPGWAAIIPIYQVIVLLEIIGKPVWWFLLLMIPGVQIVIGLIMLIDLAKVFGKGTGYGLGLFFFGIIFFPMLAFGSSQYVGVQNTSVPNGSTPRRDDQHMDPTPSSSEMDSISNSGGDMDSGSDD